MPRDKLRRPPVGATLRRSLCAVAATALAGCASCPLPHRDAFTDFYIAAHPDDIELFMGRNAWSDLRLKGGKVVFVVLTAGDDGREASYYQAREMGHERALRFWAGLPGFPVDKTKTKDVIVGGNTVERHFIGDKLVFYNLRLPDGNPQGSGYDATSHQSLKRLRSGPSSATITSVDGGRLKLTYTELKELLADLILQEGHGIPEVWVNIQEEDEIRNPFDHADHTATALTVIDALTKPSLDCVSIARYTTYVNAIKRANLSENDALIHSGTWGTLNSGRIDGGQEGTWDFEHLAWLGKEYVRLQKAKRKCTF